MLQTLGRRRKYIGIILSDEYTQNDGFFNFKLGRSADTNRTIDWLRPKFEKKTFKKEQNSCFQSHSK